MLISSLIVNRALEHLLEFVGILITSFFLKLISDQLSTREFATGEDLKVAIREVYAAISPEMIRNVFKTLRVRLKITFTVSKI